MEFQVQESRLSRLSARLNLMVVLASGLMLSNIILGYMALHALKHQKREIVPYGCNKGYVVSESSVDVHYLNLMAQNFVYSRLNVTPLNVEKNHGQLLHYIDPLIYAPFKNKLAKEETIIKSKKISSTFEITDVHSNSSELFTTVKGHLKRYVGYRMLKEEEKKYRIQYRYQQGQLTVTGFAQEKGEDDA